MTRYLGPEGTQAILEELQRHGHATLRVRETEYHAAMHNCAEALRQYNAARVVERNAGRMLLHRAEYVRSLFERTDTGEGHIQGSRTTDNGWVIEVYANV